MWKFDSETIEFEAWIKLFSWQLVFCCHNFLEDLWKRNRKPTFQSDENHQASSPVEDLCGTPVNLASNARLSRFRITLRFIKCHPDEDGVSPAS
ncbi:hypothetical protein RvY_10672 [Ramazzottius varieornatus]|uniref:Uncharacterized protein n=1 Tax=Ramazzottius varieornatus TaxID=947166 RepID=A0A1D1VDH8_RAMVA|nr:hypothetical protein RvY_10672 [Ramazzottius varieornatus]